MGEALRPYAGRVVIATKFGWNVEPKSGQNLGGFNSRPEHVRAVAQTALAWNI